MASSQNTNALPITQATSVLSFLSSIGVNAHIDSGSALWTNSAVLLKELSYLGVTNIRDGSPFSYALPTYITLAKAGIQFDLEEANVFSMDTGRVNASLETSRADALEKAAPGSILSMEGTNEYNINSYTLNGANSSGNLSFGQADDAALRAAVMQDSTLAGVKIIAASTSGVNTLPDVSAYVDGSNFHVYAGVGQQLQDNMAAGVASAKASAPSDPVYITEAGISSSGYGTAYWGVTDTKTQGIIDTNALLDGFKDGASKVYLYDLMDDPSAGSAQDQHFGLFNADGTPKAAATDIGNLTKILSDTGKGGVAAGSLAYTISGLPSTASSMLLEKSNGTFELVLWNGNATVSNGSSDVTPVTSTVTVTLGNTYQSIKVFDPILASSAISTSASVSTVSVGLAADPIIIEIPGAAVLAAAPALALSTEKQLGQTEVLTGTVSGGAGATVEMFNGATDLGAATLDGKGGWSFTTVKLAGGSYTLTAEASAPGAAQANVQATFSVLSAAPALAFSAEKQTGRTEVLTGTVSGAGGATVEIFNGSIDLGAATLDGKGGWNFTSASLAAGNYTLTAVASAPGAAQASTQATFSVLAAAPVLAVSAEKQTGQTEILTGTVSGATGASVEMYNGAMDLGAAILDGKGGWTFSTTKLAIGGSTLTAVASAPGAAQSSAQVAFVVLDTSSTIAGDVTSYSAGQVTQLQVDAADGSHTIYYYGTPGSAQPSNVVKFGSSWQALSSTTYDSGGNVTAIARYDADSNNDIVVDHYTNGNMAQATSEGLYDSTWHSLSLTTFNTAGQITQVQTDAADGSHEISLFNNTGALHTLAKTTSFDSSWAVTEIKQYNTVGMLISDTHMLANGNIVADYYTPGSPQQTTEAIYDSHWHLISQTYIGSLLHS